jgi:hypothetical protein
LKTSIVCSTLILLVSYLPRIQANEQIDLKQVRKLATLPVNQILDNSPVEKVSIENYWRKINGRDKPLSVFFYSNNDGD